MTLLPGHRAASLHILDLGLFDVGPGKRQIGIPGYLVTTDHGARVLIDGGFPQSYVTDPADQALRDGLGAFGVLAGHGPRHAITGQLAVLGLTMADITLSVLTHSHIDHVGALPLLSCPLVLTRRERAEAKPLYFGTARPLGWPEVPCHMIDAATDLCEGLRLIPTPGHTPGHLSVLVTLPSGQSLILAGDAINRASEPDEGFADAMDPAEACKSAETLFALQRRTGALLVYGHDPLQWPSLRKAPDRYS